MGALRWPGDLDHNLLTPVPVCRGIQATGHARQCKYGAIAAGIGFTDRRLEHRLQAYQP